MLKKGLFIGLVVIVVAMGLVLPALAKTDLSPSVAPTVSSAMDMEGKPSLVVTPAAIVVDKKKMPVTILGSGFNPDEEVAILIHDKDGVVSDISFLMSPAAKTNEWGAFAGEMALFARMYSRKLLVPGVYTVSAVDMEGNLLATAPVWFVEPPAEE